MNFSMLQIAGAVICGVCVLLVAVSWLLPRIRLALRDLFPPGSDDDSPYPTSSLDAMDDFLLLIELQDRLIDKGQIDMAHELDVLFPYLRWDQDEMEEVGSEAEQEEVTS
jgi:hypothetical protein